jgi:hypothetical protein
MVAHAWMTFLSSCGLTRLFTCTSGFCRCHRNVLNSSSRSSGRKSAYLHHQQGAARPPVMKHAYSTMRTQRGGDAAGGEALPWAAPELPPRPHNLRHVPRGELLHLRLHLRAPRALCRQRGLGGARGNLAASEGQGSGIHSGHEHRQGQDVRAP